MRTFFLSLVCAAGLLAAAQPVCGAPVSRVAAVVNGDMITARELEQAVKPEFIGQKVDPAKNPKLAADIRKAVLDRMINEKLIRQQAEKDKIEVSESEIDAAFERMSKESQLTKEKFLKQTQLEGYTEKAFREQLRFQIISQQVMSKNVLSKVVVTDDEIKDYYRRNMGGVMSGKARVALIVYAADADAEKLAAGIASGRMSFADVARKYSVGPNAAEGGDMGFVDLADMAQGMLEQISHMRKGEVSPVLPLGPNKAQLALLDVEESADGASVERVPDAETAKRIEQILRRPRLEERFRQYTEQLRARALIKIR